MVVVLQAKFIGVLFERHAHRPRGQRLIGVVIAPHGINSVEISGSNGAVGFQSDVPLRAQEQQHIVCFLFGFRAVVPGTSAFGEAVVISNQSPQTIQTPEEDPLDFGTELVRKKRIVLTVEGLLFHRQNQLPPVEAVRMVV